MQAQSWKSVASLLTGAVLVCGILAYMIYRQSHAYEKNMMRYSSEVISAIEEYKEEHGVLPQNIEQVFPLDKEIRNKFILKVQTDSACVLQNSRYRDVFTWHTHQDGSYQLTFISPQGRLQVYDSHSKTWKTQ